MSSHVMQSLLASPVLPYCKGHFLACAAIDPQPSLSLLHYSHYQILYAPLSAHSFGLVNHFIIITRTILGWCLVG